jgi:hypothetical protein
LATSCAAHVTVTASSWQAKLEPPLESWKANVAAMQHCIAARDNGDLNMCRLRESPGSGDA